MPDRCSWVFLACQEDWQGSKKTKLQHQAVNLLLQNEQGQFEALKKQHSTFAETFNFSVPEQQSQLVLRGVALVRPQSPFQNELSQGWPDECLGYKYALHGEALDSYNMTVQDAFAFPPWEEKPCLSRVAFPRLHHSKKGSRVRWTECLVSGVSHKKSPVYLIMDWCVGHAVASNKAVANLNVFQPASEHKGFMPLGQAIGLDSEAALDLKKCYVLCLPARLLFSLLCGACRQFPVLARWTHPSCPPLTAGLPEQWLKSIVLSCQERVEPAIKEEVMTCGDAQKLYSCLRNLGQQIVGATLDEDVARGWTFEVNHLLRCLRNHMYSLQVLRYPSAPKIQGVKFPSDSLVQQVLASLDLRNRRLLQDHAKKFVGMLPHALQPFLHSWVSAKVASGSTLVRSELMLDIALQLLHRRRLSESGEILKFAWGDAADKWNLQIYNARYRWMRKSDCVQLGRAWRFLCKHPHTRTMECDVEEKRKEYSSLLFKSIHLHTLVPQLLGNRKTALVDKVSAHVHASLLESSSLDALDESFANHICWCSDMGVESALPSFHVLSAEKVMPAWLQPSRVNVHEPDDDHFEDGVLVNLESANCKSSPLMPQAISVPGICHAIHNATGRLNSAFHGFEDFLGKLKSLYQFLGSPPRCNRFVEVVMRGTLHYERAKELFLRRLTSIYTERWNIVAICLEESLPLLLFLRTHWDDVRFLRNADDDGPSDACMKDGWSPKELTVIVQDSYFLAFWRMQLAIRKQLLHFTSWAEGCSCHGGSLVESFMNEHESEVSFEHVLKAEIVCPAGIPCRCPMAGCQAPFLAADNFSDFERKLDSTCQEFMSNCQERLTSEQWSSLLAEWQHGSKVVLEEVKARLSFFSHLPWIVFGGCHPMPDVARKALAKAKQLWDDLPSNAREAQHPIARNLFDGEQETLTQELASFISSSDQVLEDFPALEAFLAPFTFVQVAERLIEAAHKDLGQTRPKNFSVTWLSLNMRMPELNKHLAMDPHAFPMLVEAFSEARQLAKFAEMFPCHRNHPDLIKIGRSKDKHAFFAFARQALYRDSRMQFATNQEAESIHNQESKKVGLAQDKLKPKRKEVTQELIVANLATDCLRDIAWRDPGSVFSIEAPSDQRLKLFTPVLLQPSLIKRPAHAPCTMKDFDRNDLVTTVCENRGTPARPVVSAICLGKAETLSMLSVVQSLGIDKFFQCLKQWSKCGSVQYVLPLMGGDVSKLLSHMIQHGALPKASQSFVPSPAHIPSMQTLVSYRFAQEMSDGGYLLTASAIQRMEFLRSLESPLCLCKVGIGALADLSDLQLFVQMRSKGWEWSLMPVKQQKERVYKIGEEQTWYTSGVTVSRFYMMCLLDADRLANAHGIQEIPHGMPGEAYEMVFAGTVPKDALRKTSQAKRKLGIGSNVDSGLFDADVVLEAEDVPRFSSRRLMDSTQVDRSQTTTPLAPDEAGVHEEKAFEVAVNRESGEATKPVPSSSSFPESAAKAVSRKTAALESALFVGGVAKYGSFSFSVKQARSAPPCGGIEVTCRWHKKSLVTGCKRFVRFTDSTPEARNQCILLLKHWCNQACKFDRQRSHIRMPLSPGDCPPESIVLAQELTENPPALIKTDEELDAEVASSAKPLKKLSKGLDKKDSKKGSKQPKAKSSKAKPKPKGKAKASCSKPNTAKAKPAPEPEGSGQSDSSSTSSSPSSSGSGKASNSATSSGSD